MGGNGAPTEIREGRTDENEGMLCMLRRRDTLLPQVRPVVLRRVTLQRNICRRAVFRRDGVHHVFCGEPFRGGLVVSHRNLVELAVIEGEKNLFYGIRSERSPGKVWRPPTYFLNQRWTAMNQLYIGHL